jgi:hypothetical protein
MKTKLLCRKIGSRLAAGKHISLQRMLPDGALVFIRALQAQGLIQDPPVVYKVEFIGCDPEGHHQF